MALNLNAVDAAIFGLLNGHPALAALGVTGVFRDEAPKAQAFPYVRFARTTDGTIRRRFQGAARLVQVVYTVAAIDLGFNGDRAEEIDAAIDAILDDAALAPAGFTAAACLREAGIRFDEAAGEQTVYTDGGTYRIWLEEAA